MMPARSRSKAVVLAAAVTLAIASVAPYPGEGTVVLAADLPGQASTETREAFGLPTDTATMSQLAATPSKASVRWGFALSDAEEARLDIPGRMTFAQSLEDAVLPYVRSLPSFAGVWIDQAADGGLVMELTSGVPEARAHVMELMPSPRLSISFHRARFTEMGLRNAVPVAWDAWREVAPGLRPLSIAVSTSRNQLAYAFSPPDASEAARLVMSVSAQVGFPGEIVVGEPGTDVTCSGRSDCHSPFESGILIYRDYANSNWYCTMGFHISVGNDEEFLTAGHCGYGSPNDWHHPTFPGTLVGNEVATLYGSGGKDVMRVAMLDSQASQFVFAESNSLLVRTAALPIDNEAVCASRGKSSGPIVGCGVVQDAWDSWWSDTADPDVLVYGADSSIPAIPGDSGSPIYRMVNTPVGLDYLTAIGVLDHEGGFFARVSDALSAWGATIYVP